MGLYIRDENVARLAERARQKIGARTKTEAVRLALEKLLDEHHPKASFSERLKTLQAKARSLGESDPTFDRQAYADEMWGTL